MNMVIRRFRFLAFAAVLWSGADCNAQITAAVAANVQFAMEDIKAAFKKGTGIEVKTVYGASGKLATQIRNGAPFDLFVSADMDFPDSLRAWGHAPEKPRPYAYGKLVMWTLKDLDLGKGLAMLADSAIGRIALADPKRAPYGRESLKALQRSGLADALRPKLVYGENISQVSQYILTGNADIGFNAKSIVLAPETRGKGHWKEVDSALYDPIAQGAVVCRYGVENNPDLSSRFYAFLYSARAREILARYGYVLP
jgi:molybdate transport system substrate-binding protein